MNRHDLKDKWLDVAYGHAEVNRARWEPKNGVAANQGNIEAVYDYYGKLFLGDRRLEWTGMAKLIGASFYAGFLDIALLFRLLCFYEETFLTMQKKIFEDQAVMHEAYLNSGLPAIDELLEARIIDSATGRAWHAIDNPSSEAAWRAGNEWLLYREQDDIIDYFYVAMQKHHRPEGAALIFLLTLMGTPSIPGAHAYPFVFPLTLAAAPFRVRTPLPCGDIAAFPDRWRLIERDTLPAYTRLLDACRRQGTGVSPRQAMAERAWWPAV
jgi:hypothetical protein